MKEFKVEATIENVYMALFKRDFSSAEESLLQIVSSLVAETTSDKTIEFVHQIYDRFNDQYLQWVQANGYSTKEEMVELTSTEHPNYLFAHCSDPASMDDLVYELSNYLTDKHTDEQKSEVEYHLICYKKMVNNVHNGKNGDINSYRFC